MKKSDMSNYMRQEMWMDRVEHTITTWENIQGLTVPEDVRETVTSFMRRKIKRGIEKGGLMRVFMQIAVTALIYIKMKRLT
jgi:hypothetical protein